MMRNLFYPTGAVFLSLLIFSVGARAETLEECPTNDCSEAEVNAPVDGSVEDPGYEFTKFPYRMYATPEFQESWGVPRPLYEKTVAFYKENIKNIRNSRFFSIVNFSVKSGSRRLFVFDLETGQVKQYLVSHGKLSDPDKDGLPTLFSNEIGSYKSSLGFYLTLGTYQGKNGYSLRLRGLESTNNNAEARAVVMHPAKYVNEATGVAGPSLGCTAIDPSISRGVIDQVKGESLLFVGLDDQ